MKNAMAACGIQCLSSLLLVVVVVHRRGRSPCVSIETRSYRNCFRRCANSSSPPCSGLRPFLAAPSRYADEAPILPHSKRIHRLYPQLWGPHTPCVGRCRAPCLRTPSCVLLDIHRGPYRPSAYSASLPNLRWLALSLVSSG